jgi:hypothetical protein
MGANKSLGDSLARASPPEKLGERGSSQAVRRDRGEECEHRLALAEVDVRDFLCEAEVPASGRPLVLLRLVPCEEECELERRRQPDELQLRGGREGFRDVAAIEGSTETHVSRALGRHEHMFTERSRIYELTAIAVSEAGASLTSPELGLSASHRPDARRPGRKCGVP